MRTSVVSAVAIALIIAGAGCRKASQGLAERLAERAIEKDGGGQADVDFDGGRVSIKTKDGEMVAMTGESVAIPVGFPKDIFVPTGARILASFQAPEGSSLTMESAEDAATVVKRYAEEMEKQGWAEEARINTGESVMLAYKKDGGKRTVTVMVSKADKGCQVVLTTAVEKDESDAGERDSDSE